MGFSKQIGNKQTDSLEEELDRAFLTKMSVKLLSVGGDFNIGLLCNPNFTINNVYPKFEKEEPYFRFGNARKFKKLTTVRDLRFSRTGSTISDRCEMVVITSPPRFSCKSHQI